MHRYRLTFDPNAKELAIHERENPLELYQHPYAYLTARGHPGKRSDPPVSSATRTRPAPHHRPQPH